MQRQHLEARVLDIVETVRASRKVEDDRVEIKATWPDNYAKTARQIAGHANASGGEPILWIIGLDENRNQVGVIHDEEIANWWPAVKKWFDGDPPELSVLAVAVQRDERVVALQFDTTRAPYVVKVEGGGRVELEVPWREGNATRSAHRHELLRSVVEQAQVPELELISGLMSLEKVRDPYSAQGQDVFQLELKTELNIYVSATGEATLPQHRQTWTVQGDRLPRVDLQGVSIRGPFRFGKYTRDSSWGREVHDAGYIDVLEHSGLVVHGSGAITIHATTEVDQQKAREIADAAFLELHIDLPVDRSSRSCRLRTMLRHVTGSEEPEPISDPSSSRTLAKFTASTSD